MEENLVNDLNMKATAGNPSLYVKVKDGKVIVITDSFVEDSLNSGNVDFIQKRVTMFKKFECLARIHDLFDFFGAQTETAATETFKIAQHHYIKNLSPLNTSTSFEDFCRL